MKLFRMTIAAACFSVLALPVGASSLSCPDLSRATQVNACPTDEELMHTYTSYCSDNAKVYANQTDNCVRFEDYRKMKNLALWESADGQFDSYVSCDLPVAEVASLKPAGMKPYVQGSLTKLVCSYPKGINFTFRTRQTCKVESDCSADAEHCRASCR